MLLIIDQTIYVFIVEIKFKQFFFLNSLHSTFSFSYIYINIYIIRLRKCISI